MAGTVSFMNSSPRVVPGRVVGGLMRSTMSVMATAITASENDSRRRVSYAPLAIRNSYSSVGG